MEAMHILGESWNLEGEIDRLRAELAAERERYAAERKLCEEALAAAIKDTADKVVPMIRQAVAAERERCAKIAEENPGFIEARDTEWDEGVNFAKRFIAAAIRKGE